MMYYSLASVLLCGMFHPSSVSAFQLHSNRVDINVLDNTPRFDLKWSNIRRRSRRSDRKYIMSMGTEENNLPERVFAPTLSNRRDVLRNALAVSSLGLFFSPKSSSAASSDPIFAKNPLTNPVLEKFRIWNQAEADAISYGGELAPGSPDGRESYAKLLVPVLAIESDLDKMDDLAHQTSISKMTLQKLCDVLDQPRFSKVGFKKIFNAFADNIYYSDPDRANAYLAGGATPNNTQTLAYLLRNDILTNVENLQAEVKYLIQVQTKIENNEETEPLDVVDLLEYIKIARTAMKKYLELIPPGELKTGKDLFSQL